MPSNVPATISTPLIAPMIATPTIAMIEDLRTACQKSVDVREIISNSADVPLSFAARIADLKLELEAYAYPVTSHNPIEVVSHIDPVNLTQIHFVDFNYNAWSVVGAHLYRAHKISWFARDTAYSGHMSRFTIWSFLVC
ncbi:hypothetical protein M231_01915 [Tremella mesenterica]|uniref:Uncharacterized protein n=1 Tax=Tremella mesenterica TaxID=5217 RepID=A0A4Q1BSC6_TREME|nr:hypothetical protein M231_01915 [Tremella mesenterica]